MSRDERFYRLGLLVEPPTKLDGPGLWELVGEDMKGKNGLEI